MTLDEHRRLLAEAKCPDCGNNKPDAKKLIWRCLPLYSACLGTGLRFPTLSMECACLCHNALDEGYIPNLNHVCCGSEIERPAPRIPIPTNGTDILEALGRDAEVCSLGETPSQDKWLVCFDHERLTIRGWGETLDAAIYAAAVAVLEGEKS